MLSEFDNLEKIWMNGPSARDSSHRAQYNFTSNMVKNLNHLKIFFIQQIDTHYISHDFSTLSNLEFLILRNNEANFYLPFDDGVSHLCMLYIFWFLLHPFFLRLYCFLF